MLLIDAANVVGSRPDGWWRDRAKAAGRLVEAVRVAAAASAVPLPVVVVLEGVARRGAAEVTDDDVAVVHATGQGDDTLVAVAAEATEPVVVVSADRALAERCRAVEAEVVGPSWLLARISY